MKVMKMAEVPSIAIDDPDFKPGKATRQIFSDADRGNLDVVMVHFGKGCRNPWHTHSSDQVIMVIFGKGIVATEEKEYEVGPGDLIIVPAGEVHWQGATQDSEFSHFYVFQRGCKTTVVRPHKNTKAT